MSEGFFSRWSRRKQEAVQTQEPFAENALPPAASQAPVMQALPQEPVGRADESTASPLPSLEDVQALTPQSDFQPFMQQGVGPEVRNAAMKKLFADPHFNVMDGLDIYIDDYSRPDPIPAGMLSQIASAQFLKLVADPADPPERRLQDPPEPAPPLPGLQVVAQCPNPSALPEPPQHDHPDLQLQPDPAPAGPEPGPRPR